MLETAFWDTATVVVPEHLDCSKWMEFENVFFLMW
jgi:hypothetical protein